jgi:hypothetical protein
VLLSQYGRPIIKAPVWKTPDVPLYLSLDGGDVVDAGGAGRRDRPPDADPGWAGSWPVGPCLFSRTEACEPSGTCRRVHVLLKRAGVFLGVWRGNSGKWMES